MIGSPCTTFVSSVLGQEYFTFKIISNIFCLLVFLGRRNTITLFLYFLNPSITFLSYKKSMMSISSGDTLRE